MTDTPKPTPPPLMLIYDARCGACTRLTERLRRLEVPFTARHCRDPDLATVGLPPRELLRLRACRSPAVIVTGPDGRPRVHRGGRAILTFGRRVPLRRSPRAGWLLIEVLIRRLARLWHAPAPARVVSPSRSAGRGPRVPHQ